MVTERNRNMPHAEALLRKRRIYAATILLDLMAAHGMKLEGVNAYSIQEDGLAVSGVKCFATEELDEVYASASLAREVQSSRKDGLGRFDEEAINWDVSAPWIDRRVLAVLPRVAPNTVSRRSNKFKVIITHDLDRTTGFEFSAVANAILKATGLRRSACIGLRSAIDGYALLRNIERLVKYELSSGIGAVYFMMSGPYGWHRHSARTDIHWKVSRQIIKLITQAGMNVGLHGSFDARERNSYKEEKGRIEQVLGSSINMHRNHYLRFDTEKLASQMEDAGIDYDFSVGFGSHIGFRNGSARVTRAYDFVRNRTSTLQLVPLLFMDTLYSREKPDVVRSSIRNALSNVRDVGGCVSLLFHPELFLQYPEGWRWFVETIETCKELGADMTGSFP